LFNSGILLRTGYNKADEIICADKRIHSRHQSYKINGAFVTSEYLLKRGAQAYLGHVPQPSDRGVVVFSYRLWHMHYSADPAIIGQKVDINGSSYIVVGVLDPHFKSPPGVELWLLPILRQQWQVDPPQPNRNILLG
jgi:hypothetical protein